MKHDDLIYPPNLRGSQPARPPPETAHIQPIETIPGSAMLRVAGILMTVFGGLLSFFAVTGLLSGNLMRVFERLFFGAPISAALDILFYTGIALMVIYGIGGIRNAGNPVMWNMFISYGVTLIIVLPVGTVSLLLQDISHFIHSPIRLVAVLSAAGAVCVPPILYVAGGNKLRRAHYHKHMEGDNHEATIHK